MTEAPWPPTLHTERLVLRPLGPGYAADVFAGYRGSVVRFMDHGPPADLAELEARMEARWRAMVDQRELLTVAALTRADGTFLGGFQLADLDRDAPELGGWLCASAHGFGFGREAVAALCAWAGRNLDCTHLRWPCAVENRPSRRLAEVLGGTVTRHYDKRTAQGVVRPYVEYALPPR